MRARAMIGGRIGYCQSVGAATEDASRMSTESLNYGLMMQRALRGVMADALSQVAATGLPGAHHFYITFDTTHAGSVVPDWLRVQHPKQITVVLQHEFSDLEVSPDGFGVRMSFGDRPATLYAPFDAVLTFVDPSVEFGLKFDGTEVEEVEEEEPAAPAGSAEVVSLDQFRKS